MGMLIRNGVIYGNGTPGTPGEDGTDGKSAYEQAVEGGYQGTEEQFKYDLAHIPEKITTAIITDNVESSMIASKAYAVGDLLIVGDTLYKVVAPIASGATITPGTNVTEATVAEQIIAIQSAVESVNSARLAIPTYSGHDLSQVFGSAAAFHDAVAAGDFSKIHIGDYWPITLNGSYTDFARFTVPSGTTYFTDAALTTEGGTTEAAAEGGYYSTTAIKFRVSDTDVYAAIGDCTAGFTKSMNAVVKMEVAAINPYLRYGDTELTAQHVLLCSRDCLPPKLQYRCSSGVWFDTTQVNPWRGSALWETLNNADNGIIKLLEATAVAPYVFKGTNNKGMRAILPTMAAGADSPTAGEWNDRGRLFLPTEREVYGAPVWQANGYEGMFHYNQWPIFAGTGRHIIKDSGDGGGRCGWWLESAHSSWEFAGAASYGVATYYGAAFTTIRVPLCFLFT